MTSAIGQSWEETELVAAARKIVAARSLRADLFPAAIFTETAWDILLALYLASAPADRSLGALARASRASLSTAQRWIDYLEQQGLVVRDRRRGDQQGDEVYLTDKAQHALQFYLVQVLRGT